ncbi:restriction endonuclease subunit S [Hymenobacter swuensis]|uniref:Type I restriction modification DNA specificity domain-containing protein n=1 Tax=Hymenobacter swuensis DY53 TaxID=1227739 RepID=W8F9U1_9BACT|nr:restriction endonuclease subunit S [Hymenobacter swuensis]AHJ98445.1 hypothetical protein Hsw_2850 [Hymenobacter swuensis DY53]
MSNETKKTALPKLRFPEFREMNSWKESKLGEVSEIVRGGSPRPIEDFITTDPDGLNWLKIGDVAPEAKYIFKTQQKVIREALSKTREVSPGDLILSNSMSFGRPYIMKTKSCIHDGWIAIRHIADDVLTDYLYYAISSEASQTYFIANAAGAAVLNLNAERIKVLPLAIPSIEEQQKIADTLSSLDDLITAQNTKLIALQAHKRGLMQGLFPAEGETVPKLRFSEFQDGEEWKDVSFYDLLDDVLDFRGRTPPKLGMSWGGGNIISLSANNVKNGFIDFDAECNLGSEELYDKWMGKVNLEKGDIVFTMEAPLGKALLVPDSQKYILSQRVVAFKTKSLVNNQFLIQLIWSKQFQDELEKLSTGSTAKGINQKTLRTIIVKLPVKLEEQTKIADCLTSLDNRITAQTQKMEALKLHKKGIMQGLFSSLKNPEA